MSELKALLISERVFGLEDQRSAQACCYRNFPEYNEETLNNILFMSDCHLYIAIPKWGVVKGNPIDQSSIFSINKWKEAMHPQVFEGRSMCFHVFKTKNPSGRRIYSKSAKSWSKDAFWRRSTDNASQY